MTIKERLIDLLRDNDVDTTVVNEEELAYMYEDGFDASCEIILAMNRRINSLERSVRYLMENAHARR